MQAFNNFRLFLEGKKTYIVSTLMVLIGLVQLIAGDQSFSQFLQSPDVVLLLNGFGLGALRAALSRLF